MSRRALEAELRALVDELGIHAASVQRELEREPERAVRVLAYAQAQRGKLRSPASYAIARFRAGDYPCPSPADREPLTPAELEAGLEWARSVDAPPNVLQACELELELAEWHSASS